MGWYFIGQLIWRTIQYGTVQLGCCCHLFSHFLYFLGLCGVINVVLPPPKSLVTSSFSIWFMTKTNSKWQTNKKKAQRPWAPQLFPQGLRVENGVKLEHQRFLASEINSSVGAKLLWKAFNECLRLIEFKDVIRISAEDAVHNGIFFSVCCLQKTHSTFM